MARSTSSPCDPATANSRFWLSIGCVRSISGLADRGARHTRQSQGPPAASAPATLCRRVQMAVTAETGPRMEQRRETSVTRPANHEVSRFSATHGMCVLGRSGVPGGGGYAACGLERRTGYPSHRRVALETSPPGNRRSALRCPLVVPKSLCNNLLHDGRNGTVCAQTDRAVPRPSCESPIRLRYQLLVRCDRGAMELVRE